MQYLSLSLHVLMYVMKFKLCTTNDKSSAVAEMGDRLAAIDGPKMRAVSLLGGWGKLGLHLTL